ncbi:ectoine hydroxylase-related dioxygenase (phytanoyl-CoA dioxygenase family) [Paenibacillus taihuensis]|uniref:Ectoine hydroxylase-related dioxygenase (Phytanoyl-CoA dioxygenase family) n=1 Tax=Paenibacillus taihuensis TaxID=1156355 RepID=A0A3D9SIM3_9BACL|nr:phytanoyl-CoA dioxygenase family protein [Paenibacillus taihuensis]REE93130.1 ectoine hydroxylase-related dioxygenase (phytanoyl-CoA dioxygenase family) [Paenibacillus taihuensis]
MRLSIEQIISYQTEGYLIVPNVFTNEDLQPVIDELSAEIDARARALHAGGKLPDLHEDEPFERRYMLLHAQCREIGRGFDINGYLGEAIFRFLGNPNLLDVAECLLGSELSCNPIQHIRTKLPAKRVYSDEPDYFQNVPWHQDCAVTTPDSEASEIITFWLPLVDATAETGCMEVMPHVFKRGYINHHAEGGTTIVPEKLPQVAPILAECPKGGLVIMNKYTPHRGISNRSDIVRWSVDLRYHKTGAPSGRDVHPSFVVRSRLQPDSVLTESAEWRRMWREVKEEKGKSLHRV